VNKEIPTYQVREFIFGECEDCELVVDYDDHKKALQQERERTIEIIQNKILKGHYRLNVVLREIIQKLKERK